MAQRGRAKGSLTDRSRCRTKLGKMVQAQKRIIHMRASFYMTSQVAKRRLVKSPKGKNRVPLHRISAHPSYHLLRAAQFAFIGDRITRIRRNEETIFTALFLLFLLFHIFPFFIPVFSVLLPPRLSRSCDYLW